MRGAEQEHGGRKHSDGAGPRGRSTLQAVTAVTEERNTGS